MQSESDEATKRAVQELGFDLGGYPVVNWSATKVIREFARRLGVLREGDIERYWTSEIKKPKATVGG
ncbi:MAG TPA: hypothetical protein VJG30_04460 [Candidatus Nanoarchaeia archaeon]|nr:hypothetical protein [Candidatus Nanoarchaeia archaeon]